MITTALKKEYGVEKIDIKNAIITGDLDFHMKENLLDIGLSGTEVNKLKEKKEECLRFVIMVWRIFIFWFLPQ